MNSSATNPSFDDLEGTLLLAVEQIATTPPPAESAQRVLARAAKWSTPSIPAPTVRTPAKSRIQVFLAVSAALALVVLGAVAIAMISGLPREKSVAVPPPVEKTEPKGNPPDTAPATPQPVRGGGFAAGFLPKRWLSVAGEATILVAPGGNAPIQLGERQPYTKESILHVWDWSKGDKSRPLAASCESFAVSPDGRWIVTTKGEKVDIATGKVSPLSHFEPQPQKVLFSREGRRLALLLDGKELDDENKTATFRILDFEGGKKLCDIENQWPLMLPAAFAPMGGEVFLLGKDHFVRRFDARAGKELQKYEPAHQDSVRTMIVSPSGKLLVSAGLRGDILLWDVADGKLLQRLVIEPAVYADAGVYSLAFSLDETQVAGGGIGSLLLWSVETGQVKKFPDGSTCAEHIRFSADGKSVTMVRGFTGTAGPAGEGLLVYPSVSQWNVADAK